jgi:hypothetical protein
LVALSALLVLAVGAYAAAPEAGGPYAGSFQGYVYGDSGSRAELTLDLTHRGSLVEGDASIGEGLYVNAGLCGDVYVPGGSYTIQGRTEPADPKQLVTNLTFEASGFDVDVDFESKVSTDGSNIIAKAGFDLPWFCGRDPVIRGIVYRH